MLFKSLFICNTNSESSLGDGVGKQKVPLQLFELCFMAVGTPIEDWMALTSTVWLETTLKKFQINIYQRIKKMKKSRR